MTPEALRAHLLALCADLDAGRPLRRPAGLAALAFLAGCAHHTEEAVGLYGAPIPEAHQEPQIRVITPVISPESNCSDGVDNDGDGAVDEADADCLGQATILYGAPMPLPRIESDCADGIDNDGDGAIDSRDSDCRDDSDGRDDVKALYAAP